MTLSRRDAVRTLAAGSLTLLGVSPLQATPRVPGLLIRGGRIVNADGSREADLLVTGERIAAIGPGLPAEPGTRIIDARGLLVMPGGIDPHAHLFAPFADDLTTGTAAALAGGITTVGTFYAPREGETLAQAFDRVAAQVGAMAMADVMLHAAPWPITDATIEEIAALPSLGQPSCKFYMLRSNWEAQLPAVIRLLETARDAGVVTMMHCEDFPTLDALARRLTAEGKTSLQYYAESRPVLSEAIATQRAAALCELTGAPMHVVHLSSARALAACRNPDTRGLPLTVETRPLYIHLTEDRARGEDGPLYVGQPPLRSTADREAMWQGLREGTIDMLATDHAPWTRAQKLDPALSITRFRPGVSDLRFMLPLHFSEGVGKRGLSPERFVATTSTNAARTFGLYPEKGVLQEGALADIVLFDPRRSAPATAADDPSRSDYTVYEGWEVTGWPVTTIRRGEVVYEDGRVTGAAGSGRLAVRTPRGA
jgi:dihydropyrimidinase